MGSNNISEEMKELSKKCDAVFRDVNVSIDSDENQYNILTLSLSDINKEFVSKQAMNVAEKVKKFPEFNKIQGAKVSVEYKSDEEMETYEVLVMVNNKSV